MNARPPSTLQRIPVASPRLDGREKEYVLECLTTEWISSNGRFIGEFEKAFAAYCGVKHAIACNNGTSALHVALVALGLQPGDEVIVPTLTYIASANTVRYCGARPVFVDSDPRTLNLDPVDVAAKITSRTRAIMPVHLYGHPVDMDPILELAREHGLAVVEDAAEAIGATYKGVLVGGLGDCAAFSFFGNKIITTGEGGMVTTNDDALAERLRLYRGQGMDPNRRYWFPIIGYNYRMTNVAAAIGLAQLERVQEHLRARRNVAEGYNVRLAPLGERLTLPFVESWARSSNWMYTVLLKDGGAQARDRVMSELDAAGIETRPVFYPLHTLPPYAPDRQGPFLQAEHAAAHGINLPTFNGLCESDLDRIAEALSAALS